MEELNLADLGIKGEDCKNLFIKNRKETALFGDSAKCSAD